MGDGQLNLCVVGGRMTDERGLQIIVIKLLQCTVRYTVAVWGCVYLDGGTGVPVLYRNLNLLQYSTVPVLYKYVQYSERAFAPPLFTTPSITAGRKIINRITLLYTRYERSDEHNYILTIGSITAVDCVHSCFYGGLHIGMRVWLDHISDCCCNHHLRRS